MNSDDTMYKIKKKRTWTSQQIEKLIVVGAAEKSMLTIEIRDTKSH